MSISGRSGLDLLGGVGRGITAPTARDLVAQTLRPLAAAEHGHHLTNQAEIGQRVNGLQVGPRDDVGREHFAEPKLEL